MFIWLTFRPLRQTATDLPASTGTTGEYLSVLAPGAVGIDHGSTIQFMEQVRRPGSQPSHFALPKLPCNYLLNQYVNSQDQNPPVIPKNQTLPAQEPGNRPPVP
jgi:hypothetical protein